VVPCGWETKAHEGEIILRYRYYHYHHFPRFQQQQHPFAHPHPHPGLSALSLSLSPSLYRHFWGVLCVKGMHAGIVLYVPCQSASYSGLRRHRDRSSQTQNTKRIKTGVDLIVRRDIHSYFLFPFTSLSPSPIPPFLLLPLFPLLRRNRGKVPIYLRRRAASYYTSQNRVGK